MNGYRFERICRTPHSEAYVIADEEEVVARVDLHFTATDVYGVMVVERDLDEDGIEALREEIDDELVLTATAAREDFLLAVYRGTPVRVEPFADNVEALEADEL